MRALAAVALLALPGCTQSIEQPKAKLAPPTVRYNVEEGMWATEFALSDGTRCVAIYNAGLACDWQRPVVLVPRVQ